MKRAFVLALVILSAAVAARAATTPGAGSLGVGASVSSVSNDVQLFYYLTDSLMLAPQVGFFSTSYADTSGGITTNYPATWWDVGIGVYYSASIFGGLNLQIGPSFEYASENYQNEGSADKNTFTFWSAVLNVLALGMITDNLGVFTTFGVYYYSRDINDTTIVFDSLKTGFGVQSLSLGVAYYFR
jgi:hypothetical protein